MEAATVIKTQMSNVRPTLHKRMSYKRNNGKNQHASIVLNNDTSPHGEAASSFPNSLTNLLLELSFPSKRTFNFKTIDENISFADALKNQQRSVPNNPTSSI
ncbi:hypothetical protein CEXT_47221 [Caerostris extrusa]|uniref:Uncharacterized protein n=1 Tax=Caerostris extrusa TaxID=172846 RepID=A0AAV4MUX8_CAEEX|nr:hypothetical protein CEXT_47221 [Caerostris extrusa]